MNSYILNVYSLTIHHFVILISLLTLLLNSVSASAQEMIGAILQNSTSQTVDYYVILDNGAPQYQGSIAPGADVEDNFITNERIMVTPQGSDSVLQQFTFDGTPGSVLTVTAVQSAPPNIVGPNPYNSAGPTRAPQVEKPKVIFSDAFKQWLKTDVVNYDPRKLNGKTYQEGFQDKFRVEGPMRRGYNILKMDPSDLTDRGLNDNAPNIIAPLKGDSYNWSLGELGLALPNDLVILSEKAGTEGEDTTAVMFSSQQERKSSSVNVGLGLSPKTQKKSRDGGEKKGPGANGKIGITSSKTKFETSSETLIRKQIVGQGYWLVYAKEHMELGPLLKTHVSDENNLKTKDDFIEFFERFGTHWSVATLFGGYIRYEESISTKEMGETISNSMAINADATIPAKAVAISPSVGVEKSVEDTMRERQSLGKAKFISKGGNLGASYLNWQMMPMTQADNYIPLKVELRGIHELMWPELMGITDPKEANRIHALRAKMAEMLDEYIASVPTDDSNWDPRIYTATYNYIKVDKDDDEGEDNKMEFYGEARIISPDGKNTYSSGVRHNGDNTPSRSKGYDLTKGKAKSANYIIPARAVTINENGRKVAKPEFDLKGKFHFQTRFREYDPGSSNFGGADEKAHGDIYISIKEVEENPKKEISRTKQYHEDGEGIKVNVTVKRLNYELENDSFELLALPGLDRLGEGNAIASRKVRVSGPVNSEISKAGKQVFLMSDSGKCISVNGTSNGANVVPAACESGDTKQRWKVVENSIIHNSGKCLNVKKADKNVTLWACNDDDNKKWTSSGNGLKNLLFDSCIADTGTNIVVRTCENTSSQSWSSKLELEARAGLSEAHSAKGASKVLASATGSCLSVEGTNNNSNVTSTSCNEDNPNQLWTVKGKTIVHSSGKCLNVKKIDRNITLWQCNGDSNKNWVSDGPSLKNPSSNTCLTIVGSNVEARPCSSNINQLWSR